MNPRGTLLLAVVAALLGGFIYFYEIGGEADRKAADQADLRIFPELEAEAIDAIRITTQDGIPVSFVLGEAGWELVEPVRAPADATAINAMTSVLAGLSRKGAVESVGDLAEYGLDESARTIEFDAAGRSLVLRIGGATPVGGHLYVASLGDDQVSYVETFRLNAFNRNLAELRDRRVMPFEPADATELMLTWPGTRVELARGEGGEGEWEMAFPAKERADSLTVRDLLNDLSYLRAQGFVDEVDDVVTAGLEDVALEINLGLAAGSEAKLTIGGVLGDGRLVRNSTGRVFTIAPERFNDFERSVTAYRFRTLSEFDVTEATNLVMRFADSESPGRQIEARLQETGWDSDGIELDSDRIAEAIRALAQLRALTVVADEMGERELGSFGLSPAQVEIRVDSSESARASGGSAAPLAEVMIGRLDDSRGLYAQRRGDPKIYLLDSEVAESIPISSEAFANRFVVKEEASSAMSEADAELKGTELEENPDAESVFP